ncbi:hypothetical protein [Streptomyces sp. DW26H14]|uniref:hypothetical protein n=1 Tax=Streptomyces sp. DW26H14 TaxID=3435395 RepID=UPI00403DC5AE
MSRSSRTTADRSSEARTSALGGTMGASLRAPGVSASQTNPIPARTSTTAITPTDTVVLLRP